MKLTPILALFAAVTMAGCATKPAPAPSMPVSSDTLQSLEASFKAVDPNARLASVTDVLSDAGFARLGEATAADFPVGTTVALIDSNRNVLAMGTVVKADNVIDVEYQVTGARGPAVGDVAVRY
jgi:hypothetical protein